jgi:hypothetical protein
MNASKEAGIKDTAMNALSVLGKRAKSATTAVADAGKSLAEGAKEHAQKGTEAQLDVMERSREMREKVKKARPSKGVVVDAKLAQLAGMIDAIEKTALLGLGKKKPSKASPKSQPAPGMSKEHRDRFHAMADKYQLHRGYAMDVHGPDHDPSRPEDTEHNMAADSDMQRSTGGAGVKWNHKKWGGPNPLDPDSHKKTALLGLGGPMMTGSGGAKAVLNIVKPTKPKTEKPKNMGTTQGKPSMPSTPMPPPAPVTPPTPPQGTMKSAGLAAAAGRGAAYGAPMGAAIGAAAAPKGQRLKAGLKGAVQGAAGTAAAATAIEHERKKREDSRPPPRYRRSKVAMTLADIAGTGAGAAGSAGMVYGAYRGARKAEEKGESKAKGAIKGGLKGGAAGALLGAAVPTAATLIALRRASEKK